MKSFLAFLLLLMVITLISSPLWLLYVSLIGDWTPGVRVTLVISTLVLCRLVKPVSIMTGNDYKYF